MLNMIQEHLRSRYYRKHSWEQEKKLSFILFQFQFRASISRYFFKNFIEDAHPINAVMRNYDRQARDPVYRPCC